MLTDIVEEDNEDNETEEADPGLCLLRTCLLLGHNGSSWVLALIVNRDPSWGLDNYWIEKTILDV